MTAHTIIDKRAPAAAPNPASDMAAHLCTVTALAMAAAYVIAVNAEDEAFEGFIANFTAQSEKMAAQYTALAVRERAAAVTLDLVTQLRDVHAGRI